MRKFRTVLLWIVQILAALAFVAIGYGKFGNPFWLRAFARWGYSGQFRILIGVLEMTGGILLAIPKTTAYAAILIDVIMIGAAGTLLAHGEPRAQMFAPIFWMAIVSSVAYARRRHAWRPAARQSSAAADTV